jgi:hypothetical protein
MDRCLGVVGFFSSGLIEGRFSFFLKANPKHRHRFDPSAYFRNRPKADTKCLPLQEKVSHYAMSVERWD